MKAIVGPESVRLATTSRPRPAIRNRPSASVTTPSGKSPSASIISRPAIETGLSGEVCTAAVAGVFVTGSPAFFGDAVGLSHVCLGKHDLTEADLYSGDRPPFEIDQPAVDRQIAGRETDLLVLPQIAQAEARRRRDQSGSRGELGGLEVEFITAVAAGDLALENDRFACRLIVADCIRIQADPPGDHRCAGDGLAVGTDDLPANGLVRRDQPLCRRPRPWCAPRPMPAVDAEQAREDV